MLPALLRVVLAVLVFGAPAAAQGGRVVSAHGVQVRVPTGWRRVPVVNQLPDPRTLLVVGTADVRPRASQCQIAAYRVQPRGAVLVVVGWKEAALSGLGSDRAGRYPLAKLTAVHRPSFECFSGRGAVATLKLRGKAYQVNVMVGDRAPRERVREALAVARSFALVR